MTCSPSPCRLLLGNTCRTSAIWHSRMLGSRKALPERAATPRPSLQHLSVVACEIHGGPLRKAITNALFVAEPLSRANTDLQGPTYEAVGLHRLPPSPCHDCGHGSCAHHTAHSSQATTLDAQRNGQRRGERERERGREGMYLVISLASWCRENKFSNRCTDVLNTPIARISVIRISKGGLTQPNFKMCVSAIKNESVERPGLESLILLRTRMGVSLETLTLARPGRLKNRMAKTRFQTHTAARELRPCTYLTTWPLPQWTNLRRYTLTMRGHMHVTTPMACGHLHYTMHSAPLGAMLSPDSRSR